MTEEEWLVCETPDAMLALLRGTASERKLRLFSLACCQRLTPMVPVGRERWFPGAILDAAQFIEGEGARIAQFAITALPLRAATPEEVIRAVSAPDAWEGARRAAQLTAELLGWVTNNDQWRMRAERVLLGRRLREIFGNPFRPITFAPDWRTDTATALARGMYESRDFGAMPILADALQDAGCDSPDILSHCRDTNQVHVRGCWVVDLLLGKE